MLSEKRPDLKNLITSVRGRIREYIFNTYNYVDRRISIITRRGARTWKVPTYNWNRSNYKYWREAFVCQVPGLEISGLFLRPIVNKVVAWVLGRQPSFQFKNKKTQTEVERWWDLHHVEIAQGYTEAIKVGDAFIVINSDLSVTVVPAEVVDPIVDPEDYSQIIGWRIRQTFIDPNNSSSKMTITDEYYADRRIRTVEKSDGRTNTKQFPNLIGVIPVIHIANMPTSGEGFGHPEAEALQSLLYKYGETIDAAIEGNILQGRPTPVIAFKTVQNLNAFWKRYGKKESIRRSDGSVVEHDVLELDMTDVLTISDADFKYESPGSFAEDTERLLGLMFYLTLENVEIPEFVLGNAIEGSKASAETQMPVFEVTIKMRQRGCSPWVLKICRVVQGYLSLVNTGITLEAPTVQWPKISQNGRLTMEAVQWGFESELLGDRDSLLLLPLDIDRPDEVIKQAKKDAEKRKEAALEDQEKTLKMQNENSPAPPASGNTPAREMDPSLEEEIAELV